MWHFSQNSLQSAVQGTVNVSKNIIKNKHKSKQDKIKQTYRYMQRIITVQLQEMQDDRDGF